MDALILFTLVATWLVLGGLLVRQQHLNERMLMTAQEAVAQLNAIKEQNAKALGEIRAKLDALATKIAELEDAIVNQELPQSVVDAIAAVKTSSQELDDVVPDAPPPPEPA